eukprot:gene31827-38484_t
MTYGTKAKAEVIIEKYKGNYELYKVSNAETKKLAKYPVLFIPGHFGSDSQVRSLSSFMHNEDGLLQFYAVHFDYEAMAFHGGDILTKAAFVNTAIKTIQAQYQQQRPNEDFQITLIGHSYGGMIAKAALLLTNHPQCVVKNILAISAPITRAPLVPDASLEVLFLNVNKAWYTAHYNSTKKVLSTKPTGRSVNADYENPICATKTRVISVSGGETDIHVLPEYSDLFEISPHPRNKTFVAKTSRSFLMDKYQGFKDLAKGTLFGWQGAVTSLIFGRNSSSSPTAELSVDNTLLDMENDAEIVANRTMHGKFSYITPRLWQNDIVRFQEPKHFAFRSAQLEGVGFPIDHYAVAWCFQFLQAIHSGLRVLVANSEAASLEIVEGFGLNNVSRLLSEIEHVKEIGIPALEDFALREAVHFDYIAAGKQDRLFLLKKLHGNRFWLLAVQYYQRHISKIFAAFVGLAIFSVAGDLLGKLCGYQTAGRALPESGIMIHFSLLWHIFHRIMYRNNIHVSPSYLPPSIAIVLVAMALSYVVDQNSNVFMTLFFWLVSMVLAYSLLLIAAFSTRSLIYVVYVAVYSVLKTAGLVSLYQKGSKRFGRFVNKSSLGVQVAVELISHYFFELSLFTAVIFTLVTTRDLIYSPKFVVKPLFSAYMLSVITVAVGRSLFVMLVVFALLNHDKLMYGPRATLVMLAAPIVLLTLPSLEFSTRFLASVHTEMHAVSEAYHIFGPERIQFLIVLGAIFWHLSLLSSGKEDREVKRVDALQRYTRNLFKQALTDSDCVHEDGGKNSMYAKVYVEKDGDYHVGTSYKVIWCNCHEDTSLQCLDDWCEWCKCEKCSGRSVFYKQPGAAMTVSIDLVLCLVLYFIGGCVFYYGGDKLYIVLYCIGAMSAAEVVRSRFERDDFEIK